MKSVIIFLFCLAIYSITGEAQAAPGENCPQDWHPPPCGTPPSPVKNPLIDIIKQAAKYHNEVSAQLWAVMVASSCTGSVGDPRIDEIRRAACVIGASLAAVNLVVQQWENRLTEQINGARDGTQRVVQQPYNAVATRYGVVVNGVTIFDAVSTSIYDEYDPNLDQYIDALAGHAYAIEYFGQLITDSVQTTFECDAWAQYDIDGITCGNNQRAWTEQLLRWQGEKYAAVAAIEAYLASQLDVDVIGQEVVDDINYDAVVNNWEGWWLQQ